ncbi:hypothetical protein SSCG_00411 [Streptomyces clavuligerus]|nr:hypothetical protein SSCG_00411 [Streptomyces clavuligerus]
MPGERERAHRTHEPGPDCGRASATPAYGWGQVPPGRGSPPRRRGPSATGARSGSRAGSREGVGARLRFRRRAGRASPWPCVVPVLSS